MKNIKNAKKLLVWGGIGLLAATSVVTTVCLTQSDVFIIKPKKQMGIVNARKYLKNEGIYSVTEMGFKDADEFKKFCEDNNPAASGLSQQDQNARIQNMQKYLFDHKNVFLKQEYSYLISQPTDIVIDYSDGSQPLQYSATFKDDDLGVDVHNVGIMFFYVNKTKENGDLFASNNKLPITIQIDHNEGLSTGAIVGISVGAGVGVIGLIILIVWLVKRKR